MSTNYIHRTLIVVAAADQAAANAAAVQIGSAADAETFTVGYSADGALPPSHYVCSAALTATERDELESLRSRFPTASVVDYDLDTEPDVPFGVLADLGLQPATEGA